MPTYDYECDACGHKFELFQSITEEAQRKCPQCKKRKLRRLFGTGAAIMFKGSGFYQTDYRSDSYKKAASAHNGSKPTTSDSADTPTKASKESDGAKKTASESSSKEKPTSKKKPKESQ